MPLQPIPSGALIGIRAPLNQAALTGELTDMVGEKIIGRRRTSYVMTFTYRKALLFVSEFRETPYENHLFGDRPAAPAAEPTS